MKRVMALLTALLLVCSALPALAAGGEVPTQRLVETAMSLRALAYGDFMTIKGVPENIQGMARDWTAGIDETPEMIVRLDISECAAVLQYRAMFKSEHPMVSYEAQSTGMGEVINAALIISAYESPRPETAYFQITNVLNALGHSELYADPEAQSGNMLYILFYEDAEPLFILANVENGAVSLTTYIVPSMELAECTSYAQVALWFMRMGCPISGAELTLE